MTNFRLLIFFLAFIVTGFYSTSSFAQCPDGQTEVTFSISTDPWGYEQYWELVPGDNDCGEETIAFGGNVEQVGCDGGGQTDATGGNGYANNTTFQEGPFCLDNEGFYNFIFVDDFGDGGMFVEIYQDGVLSHIYQGTGNGNIWNFQIGDSNIPEFDLPCVAYQAEVGEADLIINNEDASADFNEPAPMNGGCNLVGNWCENGLSNTTWVTFMAPESGKIQISTCNSGTEFDTQIALWKVEDCTNYFTFELITSNDDTGIGGCDGGNGFASDIEATCLNPGELYYIQCDGWNGETGNYEMTIEEVESASAELFGNVQQVDCPLDKGEVGLTSIDVSLFGSDSNTSGEWTGPNEFTSSNDFIENLEAGVYEYTLISSCGVTYSDSWEIAEAPQQVNLGAQIEYPDCEASADGSIFLNPSGGTEPFEYFWVNETDGEPLGDEQNLDDLTAGTYAAYVEDVNGCEYEQTFILQAEGIDFYLGADTTICEDDVLIIEGPNNFNYSWQDGSSSSFFVFEAEDFGLGLHPIILNYFNDEGCDETEALVVTVDVCAGISTLSLEDQMVYPNPITDGKINFNFECPDCQYRIYNSQGALVQQGSVTNSELNTDVSSGYYILEFIQGNYSFRESILVD